MPKIRPKNSVQVSFYVEKEIKEKAVRAAAKHNRTQSEQLAQSLKDGIVIQSLIKEVSDYLTNVHEVDGEKYTFIPSEDECMNFIIKSTQTRLRTKG